MDFDSWINNYKFTYRLYGIINPNKQSKSTLQALAETTSCEDGNSKRTPRQTMQYPHKPNT